MQTIEAYMMIGHHTLVIMQQSVTGSGYAIATYGITPQDDGNDVAALLKSSWSSHRSESYAQTHSEAVAAFGRAVAHEIEEERVCIAAQETEEGYS
jgi:hypothetical protein